MHLVHSVIDSITKQLFLHNRRIAKALVDFRDGNADSSLFQKTLLNVVENVIQEDDARWIQRNRLVVGLESSSSK